MCEMCAYEGERERGWRERENKRDFISINSQMPTVLELNSCNRDVFVHVYMYMYVWDLSVLCIGP